MPAALGIEVRAAVGDEERVGKHRAEPLQRPTQLFFGLGVGVRRRQELRETGVGALELLGQFAQIGEHLSRITAVPAGQLAVVPQHERLAAGGNAAGVSFLTTWA